MSPRWMIETAGAIALALGCGAVSAQPCEEQWLESHGLAGPYGGVGAMKVWDDGRGPALYVGGNFSQMGDQPLNRIARWDGRQWETLADGFNGSVSALTTYQGQLIAGGLFGSSGQISLNGIASWNGSTWQPLDEGVSGGASWASVNALAEYNGDLIVGGRFESAGGAPALNVARWDGRQWHAIGSGIEMVDAGDYPEVLALLAYDGDLLVGGRFDIAGGVASESIARWNGREWSAMGSREVGTVYGLAAFQGQLIAGSEVGLFAWNGDAWTEYAGGVDDCTPIGYFCTDSVHALATINNQLIVGGDFATAAGEIVNRVGAWNGEAWSAIGGGVSECTSWDCSTWVREIAEFQGDLYVGGSFNRAGDKGANHLARWDGTTWHACAPGTSSSVRAFAHHQDDLIAAGNFLMIEGVEAQRVARWDGKSWSPLGDGLGGCLATSPYECQPAVRALTVYQGDIIAGGTFTQSGPKSIYNIARWDGRQWLDLASGVNGTVYALASYRGDLVAGGDFTMAGGVVAARIARWDGQQWHAMGNGMDYPVWALQEHEGWLVAGGSFDEAGGITANSIARWNGVEWSPMGGTTFYVYALAQHQGSLFAGLSHFPGVVQWNGAAWTSLSGGVIDGSQYIYPGLYHSVEPNVKAIAEHNGRLFVGGHFSAAGAADANFIAAWDGAVWSGLGSGTTHFVNALASYDDQLFVGGGFTSAGGQPAGYLARWGCDQATFNPADLNHDGVVDGFDLAILLGEWGRCAGCDADLSSDGIVNGFDLAILLGAWGPA